MLDEKLDDLEVALLTRHEHSAPTRLGSLEDDVDVVDHKLGALGGARSRCGYRLLRLGGGRGGGGGAAGGTGAGGRGALPRAGPGGGGTVVSIEGAGFAFSTRLKCRFGWTEVPATFVSEAEVRCAAPPGDAGPTALAVSGNGQDFVDVPAGFAYEAAPVVHGVAPPLGFAGTLVTLTGAGLGGVSACLFGDASTQATVVSETEVRCAAPAGTGSLAVGASGHPFLLLCAGEQGSGPRSARVISG